LKTGLCETTGRILGEAMPYGELIEQILLICFAYASGHNGHPTRRAVHELSAAHLVNDPPFQPS
jgi:hypothetical protein